MDTPTKLDIEIAALEQKWSTVSEIAIDEKTMAQMHDDIMALIILAKVMRDEIRFMQNALMADCNRELAKLKLVDKWMEVRNVRKKRQMDN